MSTNIIILENYPVVQWAIQKYIEKEMNIKVIGTADTIAEAVRLANSHRPDILIADLAFPDGMAADRLAELTKDGAVRALAFSEQDTWDYVEPFLAAGGSGFVSKRDSLDCLTTAINAIVSGKQWVSQSIRKPVLSGRKNGGATNGIRLSDRELEIVTLVAKGLTSKQIADQLCISVRTVENHRHRIFKKLGIRHCTQLADFAIKHGI